MNRLAVLRDLLEGAVGADERQLPGLVAALILPNEQSERGLGNRKRAVLAGCQAHREVVRRVEAVGLAEPGHVGGEVEAAPGRTCRPVGTGDREELFRA